MMICYEMRQRLRVGTDIVSTCRVQQSLDRFGARFVERIYTAREAAYCDSQPPHARAASYAGRFAAKEAVMKVLGAAALTFREIEVDRCADGGLMVRLTGEACRKAHAAGLAGLAVSIAHEDALAVATAVGEFAHPGKPPRC